MLDKHLLNYWVCLWVNEQRKEWMTTRTMSLYIQNIDIHLFSNPAAQTHEIKIKQVLLPSLVQEKHWFEEHRLSVPKQISIDRQGPGGRDLWSPSWRHRKVSHFYFMVILNTKLECAISTSWMNSLAPLITVKVYTKMHMFLKLILFHKSLYSFIPQSPLPFPWGSFSVGFPYSLWGREGFGESLWGKWDVAIFFLKASQPKKLKCSKFCTCTCYETNNSYFFQSPSFDT